MKLLLVEDEKQLASSMISYLEDENCNCLLAENLISARTFIDQQDFDCIILDLNLPDGSGLQLLKSLQADGKDDGVVIISARDSLDDKLAGLRLGADDYLTKPFHLPELKARIEAVVRRKFHQGALVLQFGVLQLFPEKQEVLVADTAVILTAKEFDLLLYLVRNKNRVVAKDALAEHLWGDFAFGGNSQDYIYTHIKNIRQKLAAAGSPDYIVSVYGQGYKMRLV